MRSVRSLIVSVCVPALLLIAGARPARADVSFADVAKDVNKKVVKIFGAGGFRGITHYCTGVLVSPDGFILTVYSPTLDATELRVHLYDGTRHIAKLIAAEPQLDVALIKIESPDKIQLVDLPFVDLSKPLPDVQPGDWCLGFSNLFEIATRDEPVSVQRGVVAAIAPLSARKGVHEAPYKGTVYIVDAITNNPGSHGGIVTNRKGQAFGLIGKELRNNLTETWVNYAMPLKDLTKFVEEAKLGKYQPKEKPVDPKIVDKGGRHGIELVPDILERTPPFVDSVRIGSTAAKAGIKPDDLVVFVRLPPGPDNTEPEERVISSCKVFKETLMQVDPGKKVAVIVRRGQQLLTFEIEIEMPPVKPPAGPG